jgi:NMD protein affecting ribosome stability and mRNA decay
MTQYDNLAPNRCTDCGSPTNPLLWPFLKSMCISCFKKYLLKVSHFKEVPQ